MLVYRVMLGVFASSCVQQVRKIHDTPAIASFQYHISLQYLDL